jgi:hypothetical protein
MSVTRRPAGRSSPATDTPHLRWRTPRRTSGPLRVGRSRTRSTSTSGHRRPRGRRQGRPCRRTSRGKTGRATCSTCSRSRRIRGSQGRSDGVLGLSPIAYWRLGEASGTSAADASGNGHTGTYVGSPTLGVAGLLTGDADTAVTFGSGKYVTTPTPARVQRRAPGRRRVDQGLVVRRLPDDRQPGRRHHREPLVPLLPQHGKVNFTFTSTIGGDNTATPAPPRRRQRPAHGRRPVGRLVRRRVR